MSSRHVNNAKREEMANHVTMLKSNGWTATHLAALLAVTSSTVNAWGRGDSMGTNAQRETLRNLRSPKEERPRMLEIAAQLRREADTATKQAEQDRIMGALHVERTHVARAARLRERAIFLETIGV